MTDEDLIERLERYASYLDGTKPSSLDPERVSRIISWELRCVAHRLKNTGFDRIPKLVSELAFKGAGFPPQNGVN